MSHAIERDRQGHARVQQIGQLLGEGGQFLQLWLALLGHHHAQAFRQQPAPIPLAARGTIRRRRYRAAFGGIHGNRKQPQPLDLDQRRRSIGDLQDPFDEFAAPPTGLV